MKKRIIPVLCLLLIACTILTACGKKEQQDLSDSKYLGTWKAVSMTFMGESESFDDECYLTLNPDGTAKFYVEGEDPAYCDWEETNSGIKLTGDTKMTFNDDGGALTTKLSGVTLRLELQ